MVRFTLFPEHDMPLNELRIALLSYMLARKTNRKCIVRVADIDKANRGAGKGEALCDLLTHFGLRYDYAYYQSENIKYHLQLASTLLDTKKAFICFCPDTQRDSYDGPCESLSPQEVLNNPNPFVIRLKKPEDRFIILSQEKYPTHTFACACDDMLQGVSAIIDEEKNLLEMPKQAFIQKSLGYEEEIVCTPVAPLEPFSEEMPRVKTLLDEGFLPEAIVNYLLLVSNPTPTDIFSLEEAMVWFDIKNIATTPVYFNKEKLHSINQAYIQKPTSRRP